MKYRRRRQHRESPQLIARQRGSLFERVAIHVDVARQLRPAREG